MQPQTRITHRTQFERQLQHIYPKLSLRWPKTGGRPIDIYFLYQLVLSHGGYNTFHEQRLWQSYSRAHAVPLTCTSSGTQLARMYVKYLLDIEKTYRKWIRTNKMEEKKKKLETNTVLEAPTKKTTAKTETPTKKNQGLKSSKTLKTNTSPKSSSKKTIVSLSASSSSSTTTTTTTTTATNTTATTKTATTKTAPPLIPTTSTPSPSLPTTTTTTLPTPLTLNDMIWCCPYDGANDGAAALACGFKVSSPNDLEIATFHHLGTVIFAGSYLEIRNHILTLWTIDVQHYLSIEKVLKNVSAMYHVLLARVYDFLEMHGYINVGVFQMTSRTLTESNMNIRFSRSICDVAISTKTSQKKSSNSSSLTPLVSNVR